MKLVKKWLPMLSLSIGLSSCAHYTQLYETKTTSPMVVQDGQYTFENDTVRIIYNFWADSGVLSFKIFNKLDVPLYIDWKRSSFIQNGQKLDYWADQEDTKAQTSSVGYYGYYRLGISNSKMSSHTVRPERVIFIAPKSSTNKNQFYLYPVKAALTDFQQGEMSTKATSKPVKIKYKQFDISNSPLVFRNFLTLSLDEQSTKDIYIDNGFYVNKISELKKGYVFKERDDDIHPVKKFVYFYDPTFFFVNL